jgi:hypothetical protein
MNEKYPKCGALVPSLRKATRINRPSELFRLVNNNWLHSRRFTLILRQN